MIVAHSMGGLVSRAAMACEARSKVERVVLLGTPNSGSFAPVQALRGVYAVVRKIARLSQQSDRGVCWRRKCSTLFRASITCCRQRTTSRIRISSMRRRGRERAGAERAAAANVRVRCSGRSHPAMSASSNIVGAGQETVTRASRRKDEFVYTITRHGDGTVPIACAELAGRAHVLHHRGA